MTYSLKLKSDRVFYRGNFRELEIGIRDGRIKRVGKDIENAEEKIDLEGKLILPGIIDGHVHFRDPGEPEKEDFASGSRAAAAGGVTTVVDMPNNTPPIKSEELFERKKELARRKSLVNFALYAGIPNNTDNVENLLEAGAIGFKYYMASEDVELSELYREVDRLDALLTVHAELPGKIASKETAEGPGSYLDTRPPGAEIEGVKRLIEEPPRRLHIAHVTLPETLSLTEGRATTEVTPHHLLLSREEVRLKDFTAVTHPPLRKRKAVAGLQELFLSNAIDMLASDHAPHRREEKKTARPDKASPGIPGVETILPLGLSFASERGLPLSVPIKMLSEAPARIFRFENRGRIKEDNWADITVVDPDSKREISGSNFHSKAKVTPFEGMRTSYWPIMTVVNGEIVFRDQALTGVRAGRFLSP